jgi:hypothetical protein
MVQCAKCSARKATVGCARSPGYCTSCCRQFAAELTAPCTKHAKRRRAHSGPSGSDDEEDPDVLPIITEQKEDINAVAQPPPAGLTHQQLMAIIGILSPAAAAALSHATSSGVVHSPTASASSSPSPSPTGHQARAATTINVMPVAATPQRQAAAPAHFPALGLGTHSQPDINGLISSAMNGTASVSLHNTFNNYNALQGLSHGLRPVAPGEGINPLDLISDALTRTYKSQSSKCYKTVDELKEALIRYMDGQLSKLDHTNQMALISYVINTLQYAQTAGVEPATAYHLEAAKAVQHNPPLYDPRTHGPTFWPAYWRLIAPLQSSSSSTSSNKGSGSGITPAGKAGKGKGSRSASPPKKKQAKVSTCKIHGAGHSNADCNVQKANKD